ncbi:MAG: RNA polymerase sigma-70 factor [Actinomycetota bacterium]
MIEPAPRPGGGAGAVAVFEAERGRLVGVAYRMLGSIADAEDVVQDAYLRWVDAPRGDVHNPPAYLTQVVSRLALDRLRSARHRREQYVGPWLPEPIETAPGPDEDVVLAESLTVGFLAVLERLGPVERAVFLLHDVFALPFAEVAAVVDRNEAACRQIARRARERVGEDRMRFEQSNAEQERLLDAFLDAAVAGDVDGLERLLAEDVVHVSDGGAEHRAARQPVVGRHRVARLIINLAAREPSGIMLRRTTLNHEPAILIDVEGRPRLALGLRVVGTQIVGVWAVVNPDKLDHLFPAAP